MCFPHVADRHRHHHTTKAGAGPWLILKCSESGRRSAVAASTWGADLTPEILEPVRRQLSVAHRVLNIPVASLLRWG